MQYILTEEEYTKLVRSDERWHIRWYQITKAIKEKVDSTLFEEIIDLAGTLITQEKEKHPELWKD